MPRLPEYNRDTVIDRAMTVFWERGYTQTSISDLVDATGLQPGSIYAAFGNKKGVFLEVLDEYNRSFLRRVRELRNDAASPLAAIAGLLDGIVDETLSGNDCRGCLSVNALLEMAHHDSDIHDRVCRHMTTLKQVFAQLVREAGSAGEVSADKDPEAMASFVINNICGMRVMCKSRPDRKSLSGVVDGVMATLAGR